MKNLMQRKTIYKRYAVNYMHVGILYANVFTELCSINETLDLQLLHIIEMVCYGD